MLHRKEGIASEQPDLPRTCRREFARRERRLKIIEVDTRQRLCDMKLTRFPIEPNAIPVKDAICGIRVLLDFKKDEASADGVHPTARKKHGIAAIHREAMKAFGHRALLKLSLEFGPGDTTLQPDE